MCYNRMKRRQFLSKINETCLDGSEYHHLKGRWNCSIHVPQFSIKKIIQRAPCIFMSELIKRDCLTGKKQESKRRIRTLNTGAVGTVVLVTRCWGSILGWNLKWQLVSKGTVSPSLVQVSSVTEEKKHADRWIDGHDWPIMFFSICSICKNS